MASTRSSINGSGIESSDAEMTRSTATSVVFSEFANTCEFPTFVIVSDGIYLSKSVQISEGDILLLKSLDQRQVTLTYHNNSNETTEVSLPIDGDTKFRVLSPKGAGSDCDSRDRSSSVIMYPTISDLLIDCPTYFEATSAYDDPYLPGVSISAGDRFRFVKTQTSKDGKLSLETVDGAGNTLILTSECRGNFCPLEDHKEYSLRELIDFSPVQRRLMLGAAEIPGDSRKSTSECEEVEDTHGASEKLDGPSDNIYLDKNLSNESNISSSAVPEVSLNSCVEHSSLPPTAESVNPLAFPNDQSIDLSPSVAPPPSDTCKQAQLIPPSTVLNLLSPHPTVLVAPYVDTSLTWPIPVSANLRVKPYTPSDYEVPQVKKQTLTRAEVRLPIPPLSPNGDMPKYPAPAAPPLAQPIVPLNINSFADIYSESLPARTKLLDISKCDPFWQKALENVYDLNVYRIEEENRLYVKDHKSEDVYSLSQDLDISFLEYPEKFSEVSELLQLPIGSELTVLEDIASDYPKPISLKFGDVLRICTNTPQFVKMKYGNRDCEVLKVEKFDAGGIEPTKLKLPIDFEVQMTMSTNSGTLKPIPLSKVLWGPSPVPSRVVAILPGDEENQKDLFRGLPSDVMILRPLKQSTLVVAPNYESGEISHSSNFGPSFSNSSRKGAGTHSDISREDTPVSMGLPLFSGAVLAFQGRLEISDLDIGQFNADFVRLPVEKLTMCEFEERERQRKLNSDYEDMGIGQDGSDPSVNECGTQASSTLQRTLSAGVLERREKKSRIDKVRRLSRALNPKHWRHSRQEPEPLPHPSAMGLMALAARPPSGQQNDYQHEQADKTNSVHSGSTNTEASSDDEETENFYEDVEIGPIKSATMESQRSTQEKGRSGPFSSFLHKSLPSPRRNRRQRVVNIAPPWDNPGETSGAAGVSDPSATRCPGFTREPPGYDVPKPNSKAKSWASKLGDKLQQARYDIPRMSKPKEGSDGSKELPQPPIGLRKPYTTSGHGHTAPVGLSSSPPSDRAPSPPAVPPPRVLSLEPSKEAPSQVTGSDDKSKTIEPIAPTRRRRAPPIPGQASRDAVSTKGQTNTDSFEVTQPESVPPTAHRKSESAPTSTSNVKIQPLPRKSLLQAEKKVSSCSEDSRKISQNAVAPKPKPRGLKSQTSSESVAPIGDVIRSVESCTVDTSSHGMVGEMENSSKNVRVPPPIKPRSC